MNNKLTKLELEAVRFACSSIMADGGDSFQAFNKDKNKMINALERAQLKMARKRKSQRNSLKM